MRFYFELSPPRSRDLIRGVFQALGSALIGRPISLQRVAYHEVPDRNGYTTCFVAKWTDGEITYDESLSNTDGNPRDGYGYDLKLELTLPQHTLRTSGDHNDFRNLSLDFASSGREWLMLRDVLRRELGEESDRCAKPYVACYVVPFLAEQRELEEALALAKQCLATSKEGDIGREEVVAWLAKNDPSAGGPAMRVKEAPGDLDGWLGLERAGDSTLTEAFARLCPYELKRWKAAGLPSAPWFSHPAWPFERDDSAPENWKTVHLTADYVWPGSANVLSRALTGWGVGTDWQDIRGDWREGVDGWRWSSSRRARVPDGTGLPLVHVTLSGVRREPSEWDLGWEELMARKFKETLTWSWIGGPKTGDALVIVERALPKRQNGTPEPSGIAIAAVGSSEFRERAEATVIKETRCRWYPVSAADSLKAWVPQMERFPDALAALEATVTPERLARAKALLTCRCPQPIGYCEHRREILQYVREDKRGETPAAEARSAAWDAAFHSVGDRPEVEMMRMYLGKAYSAHVRAAEFV